MKSQYCSGGFRSLIFLYLYVKAVRHHISSIYSPPQSASPDHASLVLPDNAHQCHISGIKFLFHSDQFHQPKREERMSQAKEMNNGLEWTIKMVDRTTQTLVPHEGPVMKAWNCLVSLFSRFVSKIWGFLLKAWNLGVADPRKVIHSLKVGMALSVVSLFYYMRPLYEGVGGNTMWAVMTVVVVFEQTVGKQTSYPRDFLTNDLTQFMSIDLVVTGKSYLFNCRCNNVQMFE